MCPLHPLLRITNIGNLISPAPNCVTKFSNSDTKCHHFYDASTMQQLLIQAIQSKNIILCSLIGNDSTGPYVCDADSEGHWTENERFLDKSEYDKTPLRLIFDFQASTVRIKHNQGNLDPPFRYQDRFLCLR